MRDELFERAKDEARASHTFKRKSGSWTGVTEVEDSEKRRVSKKVREQVMEKKREEMNIMQYFFVLFQSNVKAISLT